MSETSEFDYLKGEQKSDVMFIVEEQTIPALKSVLSVISSVFRDMFSGNCNESKVEEIVIEDTTYEAFKTFIYFLYCDHLVLKDINDFELTQELYKLSEKYKVPQLSERLTLKLYEN